MVWVVEAIDYVIARFPFPILGIDSDNGSEFINAHLYNYCIDNEITFTRSRAGNSNDGAHVEQKNWTHVRELVGYLRFDTEAELLKLNEIWELDATYTNYLLAQQKLIFKQRNGAKVTKKYDPAKTPRERATAYEYVTAECRSLMNAAMAEIRPGTLYRSIQGLTKELERMALGKAPAPIKPTVNPSLQSEPQSEGFWMRQ